jgi:hypothetical protein
MFYKRPACLPAHTLLRRDTYPTSGAVRRASTRNLPASMAGPCMAGMVRHLANVPYYVHPQVLVRDMNPVPTIGHGGADVKAELQDFHLWNPQLQPRMSDQASSGLDLAPVAYH